MSTRQFPYPIEQITELPMEVQQALMSQARSNETFRSILRIPPFQHFGPRPKSQFSGLHGSQPRRTPEWILALTDDRLFVIARDTAIAKMDVTVIPLQSMIAFEWGVILLYSWIDIAWADAGVRHTRVEYNTVGENYLRALLAALQRAVLARMTPVVDQQALLTENQISALPMNFANMLLNRALLAGEHVYTYCFEPTLKPKWFWGHRRDGLLWAVTNEHGLFIREPSEAYPYGVVFTFCPRGEIREARVVAIEQEVELCLTLGEPAFEVKGTFPLTRQAELKASIELLTSHRAGVSTPIGLEHAH